MQTKGQHIQTMPRPRGQTFGSLQNWCHVKGHELWLETCSWNVSLKAQLKGQRGSDLFWSTITREASGTNGNFESSVLLKKELGGFLRNKTPEAVSNTLPQIGKPWGTRLVQRERRNRAKEKQLSTRKEEMLLYKSHFRVIARWPCYWRISLFSRTCSRSPKYEAWQAELHQLQFYFAACCLNINKTDVVTVVAVPPLTDLLKEDSLQITVVIVWSAFLSSLHLRKRYFICVYLHSIMYLPIIHTCFHPYKIVFGN